MTEKCKGCRHDNECGIICCFCVGGDNYQPEDTKDYDYPETEGDVFMTEQQIEQKAEEIAKDIYMHHFDNDVNYPCVLQAITIGVQKGAEFGYNKANEWHEIESNPKMSKNV